MEDEEEQLWQESRHQDAHQDFNRQSESAVNAADTMVKGQTRYTADGQRNRVDNVCRKIPDLTEVHLLWRQRVHDVFIMSPRSDVDQLDTQDYKGYKQGLYEKWSESCRQRCE